MQHTRHRFPWSINEINRLYSEYENKKMTIQQIAKHHKRTNYAILYKLVQEELIHPSWNDARGWCVEDDSIVTITTPSATAYGVPSLTGAFCYGSLQFTCFCWYSCFC